MNSRLAILAAVSVVAAVFMSGPAHLHGQQPSQAPAGAEQHAAMMNMMARMTATDQKLDDLVKKVNAAQGSAKVDALAETVTALVQDQRSMHAMCSSMMGMMGMPGMTGASQGHDDAAHQPAR